MFARPCDALQSPAREREYELYALTRGPEEGRRPQGEKQRKEEGELGL